MLASQAPLEERELLMSPLLQKDDDEAPSCEARRSNDDVFVLFASELYYVMIFLGVGLYASVFQDCV